MELRPLGFGEIFDRAVTLYIRNLRPFLAIVLVLIVPLAVVQYIADASQAVQLQSLLHQIQHPGARMPLPLNPFGSPGQFVALLIVALTFYLLWPFALNAVAVGVMRLYRGELVVFADCYRAVLPRWLAILGMLSLQALVGIAWYAVLLLVTFVSVLVSTVLFRAWVPLGSAAIVLTAFLLLALIASLAPLFVTLTFAMNAVVIEGLQPVSALVSGFNRVFTRREFWRATLFSLAAGAIAFGSSLLIAGISMAALALHAIAIEVVLSSILRAVIAPFSIVLVVVYYFDVRIRREGFDLEAELERLASPPRVA